MFLSLLKDAGYGPATAADVDANGGAWSRAAKATFPGVNVVMIDDENRHAQWKDIVAHKFVSKLGPPHGNGKATFYKMEDFLPPGYVFEHANTLDQFVPQADIIHLGMDAKMYMLSDRLLSKATVILTDDDHTPPAGFEKVKTGFLVRSNASFIGALRPTA